MRPSVLHRTMEYPFTDVCRATLEPPHTAHTGTSHSVTGATESTCRVVPAERLVLTRVKSGRYRAGGSRSAPRRARRYTTATSVRACIGRSGRSGRYGARSRQRAAAAVENHVDFPVRE